MTEPGDFIKSTRREVHKLALEGLTGTEISKALKISRQAVSKHLLALVKDGFLRPVGNKSSPRLYQRTAKGLPALSTVDHRGWSPVVRGHRSGRLFKLTERPSKGWPWLWDNHWVRSGVKYHLIRDLTLETPDGQVHIKSMRYIEGPKSASITIWTDDDHITDGFQLLGHDDYSTEVSIIAVREIAKRTGLRVALPEVPQPTEYGMNAPPGVVDRALEEDLGTDKVWFDRSKGKGEIETTDKDIALTWLHLPEHIETLRKGLQEVKTALVSLGEYAKDNNETVKTISEAVEVLDKRTRVLVDEMPIIDDPWEGMYG